MRTGLTGVSTREVELHLLDELEKKGYRLLASEGLISPAFPDTFVPSAFHATIRGAALRGPSLSGTEKHAGCDWVYRHVDEAKVGLSPAHLSSFRMLVYFSVYARAQHWCAQQEDAIRTFADILSAVGLSIGKCTVTYFGGGTVCGVEVPADEESPKHWAQAGVREENLIAIRGEPNFTNVKRPGEPAGPRCEIYHPLCTGELIEIGTVAFERYLIHGPGKRLVTSTGLVYGGALGVERLATVIGGHHEVFGIGELYGPLQALERMIDPRLAKLSQCKLRVLVDAIRTLLLLSSQEPEHNLGRRVRRLRELARRAQRCLAGLGLHGREWEVVGTLAEEFHAAALMDQVGDSAVRRVTALLSSR